MDIQRRLNDANDMTSMVDVTFLLLIFFMVTASFVTTRAIVNEPAELASVNPSQEPNPVRVIIDEDDQLFIENEGVEEPIASSRELREVMKAAINRSQATAITIEAHEQSRHKSVVQVCDVGRAAGLNQIQVNPFK